MVAQLDIAYWRSAGFGAAIRRAVSYGLFEGRPATTKGQWFNPVVAWHLQLGQRVGSSCALDRPIFVVGVGRSGTTHLGRLLSAHPDVGWLNEPKLLWNSIVSDEDVSGFYSSSGRFLLDENDATPGRRTQVNQVLNYYLTMVRAKRLVDKYPEMTYRIPFIKRLFPNAIVVAIVRRPEDFVNSVVQWNGAHGSEDEDWWGVRGRKWTTLLDELVPNDPEVAAVLASLEGEPTSAEMAATEWVLGMRALVASNSLIDAVIQYEQLATNPLETTSDLLASCQLSAERSVLQLAAAATSSRLRTDPADFGALGPAVSQTRRLLNV